MASPNRSLPDAGRHYHWRDWFSSFPHGPVAANDWMWRGDYEPHVHDFIEIQLVVGGRAVFVVGGEEHPLSRGSLVIMRPGALDQLRRCDRFHSHVLAFSPELYLRELAWVLEHPVLARLLLAGSTAAGRSGVSVLHVRERTVRRAGHCLGELARTRGRDEPALRPLRIGLLLQFLGVVLQDLETAAGEAGGGPAAAVRLPAAVTAAMRCLEAEPAADWRIAELARRLHVSTAHLIRLFKAATGSTPLAYVARLRTERASVLLLNSQDKISTIGFAVGWRDPVYFARRFRQQTGLTPSAYRERYGRLGDEASRRILAERLGGH